jgi:hypothetical protein
MSRAPLHRTIPVLIVLLVVALGAAAAQSALQQLHVSEEDARGLALSSIVDGYVQYGIAADAVKAMPQAARGPAIEAGIAWARAYVSSPAFAKEYAAYREGQKPQPPESAGSVDDELKRQLAEQQAQIDESKKNMAELPPEVRAGMQPVIAQMEAMMKDPETLRMMRMSIEMDRAEAKTSYATHLQQWQEMYPADPRPLIAKRLQAFLDASADVDFSAELVDRDGSKLFAKTVYEQKPGEWKLCYRAGKEATAAARTAATAWLTELAPR